MNKFDDARLLDSWCYDSLLTEQPRSANRAKISSLANGQPPFSEAQVSDNNLEVNFNDLTMTRRLHDARTQMANGLLKTGNYFVCRTDSGAVHKRAEYGRIRTQEIGRVMKRSIKYYEQMRAKIGNLVLHGIGPAVWENEDLWSPRPIGIEDVLIPSHTLLGFENLPFIIFRRQFTGMELQRLTRETQADDGWNRPFVERCLRWLDEQTTQLRSQNWPDVYAPEKIVERVKEDGGSYVGDRIPTLDCFDIYGYSESENETGWVRRIILDSWENPALSGGAYQVSRKSRDIDGGGKEDFLFTSGERKVAKSWKNLVSFTFADLSSVFPQRYHSVRGLGFLLWAVCLWQNRLRCRFNEAVAEAMTMYFYADTPEDVQRALKVNLINRGFIDKGVKAVPATDRFQVPAQLVELGLAENNRLVDESSGLFAAKTDYSQDRTEKTRFQVMAELNAASAMLGGALAQAYKYQEIGEDQEISRRFCQRLSTDPDVQRVQANCLRQGIPEELVYNAEAWDVEHERVMGGGDKTREMTIAQQLMEWRPLMPAESQNKVLRKAVFAFNDDPAEALDLVPEEPHVSDSIHDSEFAFGVLMGGTPVTAKPGLNAVEVIATMIRLMQARVIDVKRTGGVGGPPDVIGLNLCEQYAKQFLQMLSEDKASGQLVRLFEGELTKIMNEVKGFMQRQSQAAKARQQGNGAGAGGVDPKELAKAEAIKMQAQNKVEMAKRSHAARTAQKQLTWEQQMRQRQEEHAAEIQAKDIETAATINRNRLTSMRE